MKALKSPAWLVSGVIVAVFGTQFLIPLFHDLRREWIRSSVISAYQSRAELGELPQAASIQCYAGCMYSDPNLIRLTTLQGDSFCYHAFKTSQPGGPPWEFGFLSGKSRAGDFLTNAPPAARPIAPKTKARE